MYGAGAASPAMTRWQIALIQPPVDAAATSTLEYARRGRTAGAVEDRIFQHADGALYGTRNGSEMKRWSSTILQVAHRKQRLAHRKLTGWLRKRRRTKQRNVWPLRRKKTIHRFARWKWWYRHTRRRKEWDIHDWSTTKNYFLCLHFNISWIRIKIKTQKRKLIWIYTFTYHKLLPLLCITPFWFQNGSIKSLSRTISKDCAAVPLTRKRSRRALSRSRRAMKIARLWYTHVRRTVMLLRIGLFKELSDVYRKRLFLVFLVVWWW